MEVCRVNMDSTGDAHALPISELETSILHNIMEFLDISFTNPSYVCYFLMEQVKSIVTSVTAIPQIKNKVLEESLWIKLISRDFYPCKLFYL